MPFVGHTPESLLPRADSKNPATTCKGITSSGRPCRRAVASPPRSSPTPSPSDARGVLAVLKGDNFNGARAAAFFCWQHQNQAETLASGNGQRHGTEVLQLKQRTSIDTLVDRLGVLKLEDDAAPRKGKKHKRATSKERPAARRDTLPEKWHDISAPLMTVPEDFAVTLPRPEKRPEKVFNGRSNVKPSIFCCVRPADDEVFPPARRPQKRHDSRPASSLPPSMVQMPHKTLAHSGRPSSTIQPPSSQSPHTHRNPTPTTPSPHHLSPSPSTPSRTPHSPDPPLHTPNRPPLTATPNSTSSSQTQSLLSLIPTTLSPQTTSGLLTELAKPISPADEAGYIYMFWLTPDTPTSSRPDAEIASSLLSPPTGTQNTHGRRTSDVLRSYQQHHQSPTANASGKSTSTILLKIGRTSNVHRRLSEWSRQCSHNLTLIRWYPYLASSSAQASPTQAPPRKVPHVHRVERLIHIELAEKRATGHRCCAHCGREHREWFEVEGTREGVRGVDDVVRRWVGWGERLER